MNFLSLQREVVEKHRLMLENISLKSQLKESNSFKSIIGKSHVMQNIFNLIEKVSKSNSNVMIIGESRTGKELVARAIHYESLWANGSFIPIDCAALPEELLESELFGYEKGSFTEMGELSLNIRKKFLRFLQKREVRSVGGKHMIKVDVRIIAATNRDLESEVKRGNFREDLFYRLNVVTIHIPPLRERKEDIPLLAGHFLNKFNKANNKVITAIDSEAMRAFMDYNWPGNVGELENVI